MISDTSYNDIKVIIDDTKFYLFFTQFMDIRGDGKGVFFFEGRKKGDGKAGENI